jgi:hypothetical protein
MNPRRRALVALLGICAGLCLTGLHAPVAAAEAAPDLLWQVPEDGQPGSAAGEMNNPRGVAVNDDTGQVYVADLQNSRVDEFTVWGEFVRAWGFGVRDGMPELEVCTAAPPGCRAGLEGDAAGQLGEPFGIAVDSAGAVYVYDLLSRRVTKYDEHGNFLLTFGGNVNQTTGAEICTQGDVEADEECGAGDAGSDPGFFSISDSLFRGNFIAVSPSDTILVGDVDRIQEFEPDGNFKSEIPFSGSLSDLAGFTIHSLAVDPTDGDIYLSSEVDNPDLYRIPASRDTAEPVEDTVSVGGQPKQFPVNPAALAVDAEGDLYVVDHGPSASLQGPFEVLKFSSSGSCLICGASLATEKEGTDDVLLNGLATSDACGIEGSDLYVSGYWSGAVSWLRSYGPPPQDVNLCPPPEVAPEILDQFSTSVGLHEAAVFAHINPKFWKDATYYVQYGPQECLDSGWTSGCSTEPAAPGNTLTDKVLSGALETEPVLLQGLQPGTVYYYRFVAESGGGGPVRGIGGTETEEGEASSFQTFASPLPAKSDCPNQPFRTGAGALLPDCRAYEMVSPIDKDGGEVMAKGSWHDYPAALDLGSLDGDTATFSSSTAFADAVSSPYTSQYIARRDPASGWQTQAISPPRDQLLGPGFTAQPYELDLQFKLFSPDLSSSWLMQEADPPLDGCGVAGFINWYRRDNTTGGYEAITTKQPGSGVAPLNYLPEVQGTSEDGSRTFFRANAKLPVDSGPEAADISGYQLYEHVAEGSGCGTTRLVSVLPDGTASALESSVGTAATSVNNFPFIEGRENLVHNAVSRDGAVVYWTAAGENAGQLYVRAGGTTAKVSAAASARFWWAAADGSSAYYTEGEKLLRFDLAESSRTTIATEVSGFLGASEDGTRAYFLSNKKLGGAGVAGRPNLYLFDAGTISLVATLSSSDVDPNIEQRPAAPYPPLRTSSVSEDGRFVAFTSSAGLAGHDNTDAATGLPDSEAYLYEAGSHELRCVSCPATGTSPRGKVIYGFGGIPQGYAAGIPPWKNQFHRPRVISADGSRVYFESLERLVPRDTNAAIDVYMWARAENQGACEAVGAELFNPQAGGCISLISSGTARDDAIFVHSTPDASNVFFKTSTSLLPQDPNRVDLYDARVSGGFPPPAGCSDPNGCQAPPTAREPGPPPSPSSARGSGNPDFSACEKLEDKAAKQRAKAARLRRKARKAAATPAKRLGKRAKKATWKAKRFTAQAKSCNARLKGK